MSSRLLVLGLLSLGAAGQMACSTDAEAGQASATSHADVLAQGGPPRDGRFCGGFAAVQCPEGLICADDTSDDCDPNAGGRDCGGICVVPNDDAKPKCDYSDPRMNYLSREPDKCPAIRFQCPEGATAFFNDCGCGCEKAPIP